MNPDPISGERTVLNTDLQSLPSAQGIAGNATSQPLLNPRLPAPELERWQALFMGAPKLTGYVWLATSGSGGRRKLVALSEAALKVSADAVNRHLQATGQDVWLLTLPDFHVGGLSLLRRAELSNSRVARMTEWNAAAFVETCEREGVTLASLVSAQVFDCVRAGLRAPKSLRAILVGGGGLSPGLYHSARALGWPLLPTYGMTEAGSQVATAQLASLEHEAFPALTVLPHIEARVSENGCIAVKGPSLLTGYVTEGENGEPTFIDPKDAGGWYQTEDRGEIRALKNGEHSLIIEGRTTDMVKVGGETVSLPRLEHELEDCLRTFGSALAAELTLCAAPDERLGRAIVLVASYKVPTAALERIRSAFDSRVAPFERIRRVERIESVPRSSLGKVLRADLGRALKFH